MSSSLIFITSGIVDYLIFTSLIAAILVMITWGIIKMGKIRAPVYHYVISKGASLRDYANLLSRIVEHGLERKNLYAIALFEGRLLLRVRALLDSGNRFQIKASRRAVLAGAMVILLA